MGKLYNKICSINESFFKKIDDENKAYFLGLLFADGYHDEKGYRIKLSLTEKDVDILNKVRKSIKSTHKLYYEKQHDNAKPKYSFTFRNKQVSNDLIKLGLRQRKSFTCRVPKLNRKLYPHFIRGYFDGDGTIGINKKGKWGFGIYGNQGFLKDLLLILPKELRIQMYNHHIIYKIQTGKKSTILNFYDYLYKDATIWLDRKYDIWNKIRGTVP